MEFKEVIRSILKDPKIVIALSDEFEVAQSTVIRWANGVSRPHPSLQTMILSRVHELRGHEPSTKNGDGS